MNIFYRHSLLDLMACLTKSDHRDILPLHPVTLACWEDQVFRLVAEAIAHHQPYQKILLSRTISPASRINHRKRMLADHREEDQR